MILPDNIDLANSQKYSLSIRLIPNGFSFSIFLSSDTSVFFTKEIKFNKSQSYIDNLKRVFFEVNLFAQPYKEIIVTSVSPNYTLVPNEFYDKGIQNKLFKFNFVRTKSKILSNELADIDAHIIYDMDDEIYAFLHRNLWSAKYIHFAAHLLPAFITHKSNEFEKRCFVEINNSILTIACFKQQQLLYVNSYLINDQLDTAYHIVNTWEKHKLNQNKDGLFLSGDLNELQPLIDLFKQLIKHVALFKIKAINQSNIHIPTDLHIQL